jgi:WD40 repeat protein
MEDRSLNQWITEPGDAKSIDPKKATIKKIAFNEYGDKMYCNNVEGNIFVFNFDTKEQLMTMPIYTLKRGKEDKLSDFDLISADTVYALTAQKPKRLWIYDTLLSSRGGLVLDA